MANLSSNDFAWRSFKYFGRSHVALCLGIAAATAVIVGALVVGDSVRGSLRGLVVTRLANIESLLTARNFFHLELLSRVKTDPSDHLVPLILQPNSSVEFSQTDNLRRATRVQVLGIDDRFTSALDPEARQNLVNPPENDEVIINQSLADELGAKVGDVLTILLPSKSGVPADSPLGRREETAKNLPRQKVVGIISDQSIGAVNFRSTQEAPLNVFASLRTLQETLEVEQQCNAAVVMSDRVDRRNGSQMANAIQALNGQLHPTLEDLSLQIAHHSRVFPDVSLGEKFPEDTAENKADREPKTVYDYLEISSKDLLIDKQTEAALVEEIGASNCTRLLTYLVNATQKVDPAFYEINELTYREPQGSRRLGSTEQQLERSRKPAYETVGRIVPYSIIVGVSARSDLGISCIDQPARSSPTAFGAINQWLANQLQVSIRERIQFEFYLPETLDGKPVKGYFGLRVDEIVPITEPEVGYQRNKAAKFKEAPTVFNDPNLTPSVPGITDKQSLANWDAPFPLEYRSEILEQDERYWDMYRTAPKVFMPLSQAQVLFGSRFGNITSIRIPIANAGSESELREQVQPALDKVRDFFGLSFLPIRQQQLRAAVGATPFDMLFLSLSFFVILAAIMLVGLLFRLSIQQRASQLGVLFAQGFTTKNVRRFFLKEFSIVAAIGAMLGIPLGLAYARLMIAGLQSWWIGAISTNFLQFRFGALSLLGGALAGVLVCLLTIYFSLRSVAKVDPLSLLRGNDGDTLNRSAKSSKLGWAPALISVFGSVLLAGWATGQNGMARAGCFFGSGLILLVACWFAIRQILVVSQTFQSKTQGLLSLALGTIRRNPLRSSLSIGLLAVASFLIASMGVFRMSPTKLGCGGFDLVGTSSQPIYINMGSAAARQEAIGPAAEKLVGSVILPIRMREGDDASCTNLFQANSPTILGLPSSLQRLTDSAKGFQFPWAASLDPRAPWEELQYPATGERNSPIPVVLDLNTAMWSLKQGSKLDSYIGIYIDGNPVYFIVVGLLNNSLLQGKLIIAERNFQRLFPNINGYRYFLINSGEAKASPSEISSIMENGWSLSGMDVTSSEEQLSRLLGVQNTYISAFQSLGALGLLLGTVGLMAIQLRSVWERRSELALMQSVGFTKTRIGNLLTLETIVVLGLGIIIGVVCSAIALIPFVFQVGPQLSVLQPLILLAIVFACGLLAAFVAIRRALKLPLLDSLRHQ